MKTFLAYDIKTNRIFGYTRATSKRAATANLKRGIKGRTFGGRFGLHTMLLSNWTESEIDRAGGFAIPRPADVQADMNAAFGWETETETETCPDCGGTALLHDTTTGGVDCVDCGTRDGSHFWRGVLSQKDVDGTVSRFEQIADVERQTMLKPRQIAAALPDVSARKAGDWLRGDRSPSVQDLGRILDAFPDLDARWFIGELAKRRAVKLSRDIHGGER